MEEGPFLRRIQAEFPDLRWTSHRYLTHGWDHAVLILDEAIVFRAATPRRSCSRASHRTKCRLSGRS